MNNFWPNKTLKINDNTYIYFGKRGTVALVPKDSRVIEAVGEGPVSAIDDYGRCCLGEEFLFDKMRGWKNIKQLSIVETYEFTKA